jgi:hypothetical protein
MIIVTSLPGFNGRDWGRREEAAVTMRSVREKDCRESKTEVNNLSNGVHKEWRIRNERNNDKASHTGNKGDPPTSTSARIKEPAGGDFP